MSRQIAKVSRYSVYQITQSMLMSTIVRNDSWQYKFLARGRASDGAKDIRLHPEHVRENGQFARTVRHLPARLRNLRAESGFAPAEQEVVFLTISRLRGCEYCTAGHSFAADRMSNVPGAVIDAIRNDTEIPDERLPVLSKSTQMMIELRGLPKPCDVEALCSNQVLSGRPDRLRCNCRSG